MMQKRTFVYLLAVLSLAATSSDAETAQGKDGIVASAQPLASQAGIRAFESGGNAIDAAVAIALTLGVVDGHNSGIGGGCFMLLRRANGEFVALDGREMAPAAASHDMFLVNGKGDTELSQTGPLASGIPGSLAVYDHALQKYGRKSLRDLILPAAEIAEKGFPIDRVYASKLKSTREKLALFPASKSIYLHGDGTSLAEGETLKLTDLGGSYRKIAEHGTKWFYGDGFPQIVDRWMKENHGIITAEDFAKYRFKERDPIRSAYRDFVIVSFPPPSSGGPHVAQILNILEKFDIPHLAPADRVHVMAEAMKLAFADRAYWLGDPDFVKVPLGLIDEKYGETLASRISMEKAMNVETHGDPPDATQRFFNKHTTHFSTADSEGNWVACTATINTAFGSKVVVPGTGILLNNQMDDFSTQPGVPNAFHLIGGEANSIAPGKRPLSSMSPTIVLKNGKPFLALGAGGGPKIITQVVINLVGILDLGLPLDQALGQPRFHHQWQPNELTVEKTLPRDLVDSLKARGHTITDATTVGSSQVIGADPANGELIGASEPRIPSKALGWTKPR
jgi:gamma-glutamyltranspeptidase/glutathione hydrolase